MKSKIIVKDMVIRPIEMELGKFLDQYNITVQIRKYPDGIEIGCLNLYYSSYGYGENFHPIDFHGRVNEVKTALMLLVDHINNNNENLYMKKGFIFSEFYQLPTYKIVLEQDTINRFELAKENSEW